MSVGTPVVALRRGSVPEVVLHGRSGVVCVDESELADGLHQARTLDPGDCVAHVRTSFSVELMARRHERLYRRLIVERRRGTASRTAGRHFVKSAPVPGADAAASAARSPSRLVG